jgi:eukaryotic-like serine/threonine-protein kinase
MARRLACYDGGPVDPSNSLHRRKRVHYRFGSFEVWCDSGVLLHKGTRVRVQELPLQMLMALLETPGEVVSREELRQRLWSDKTFVEFDNNLRVAAAKLREALHDSVTEPQYVETVARRGYRFVGQAEMVETRLPEDELAGAAGGVTELPPEATAEIQAASATLLAPGALTKKAWPSPFIFGTAVLAAAVVALPIYRLHSRRPLLTKTDSVALGPIVNQTGDHAYDDTLSLPFHIKMEESPFLRILPAEAFRSALHAEPSSAGSKARFAACRSLGAKLLLGGELLPAGQGFHLHLAAYNCSTGRQVVFTEESAGTPNAILAALGKASEQLRLRLGEPSTLLNRFNVPLMQATTGSLAALHAFRLGEQMHLAGREQEAVQYDEMAIDLDPQFALAYSQLGTVYSNLSEYSSSRAYYQKACDLRERTTDHERLYIATSYYRHVNGDLNRAIAAYELWGSLYPNDFIVPNNLADIYMSTGDYAKALTNVRRAIELSPTLEVLYANLAAILLRTGDYTTLKLLCDDRTRSATSSAGFHEACYENAAVHGDWASMKKELDWAKGSPQQELILRDVAEFDLQGGRVQKARQDFAGAIQSGLDNHHPEFAALIELNEATDLGELGLTQESRQLAIRAAAFAPSSAATKIFTAMDWALLGNAAHAHAMEHAALQESPQSTLLLQAQIPAVEAMLAYHTGEPEKTLASLEQVRPYDLCYSLDLMPGYYRGMAYLRTGQTEKAIAEFQDLLRHQAANPQSLYITMAKLRLAQALYAEKRDAAPLVRDLEAQWKDADKSFPLLAELHTISH